VVHFCLIYFFIVSLAATGAIAPTIIQNTSNVAFKMYWGFANGPLAISALSFGNAMVFHDKPNLASCFIHLTPCSLTWSMRWYEERLAVAWPGIFDIYALRAE